MKLIFDGNTDKGCARPSNQDAFYIDPEGRYFIVADGMGGHAGGEVASRLATETVQQFLDQYWNSSSYDSDQILREAIARANRAILQDQVANPSRSDAGTTIVVVIFREQQPWYCHVGDSRLYRLRGTKLEQISEDHTWIARAIQNGVVDLDEARRHPWRHMLLQCLGREDLKVNQAHPIALLPGDRLLICSDGLTEELTDERITHHLKTVRSSPYAVRTLIEAAKAKGGRDNITVIVITSDRAD
ncbi:MAG: protein phosphatase 2C domain-containing protein [Pseudanabaenaceae cyanobacterium bins.68]|nr:protein phosphatase 2C domain-containing protein [Pseudanabaenaceae cyanobacterium bins.68]